MKQNFTAAAQRAIQRANHSAEQSGDAAVTPQHLLHALTQEESKASEILTEFGFPILQSENEKIPPQQTSPLNTNHFRFSTPLNNVFTEAELKAGRGNEVGTDHLLWGLATVSSPTADILQQHNLTPETLALKIADESESLGEPLPVDFSINFDKPNREGEAEPQARENKPTITDIHNTLRILDAAANRTREGLRVLEDFVRFTLDDSHLSGLLKSCRHDLAQALRTINGLDLIRSRETQHDVGTTISTPAESVRSSPSEVLHANFKRVQEATRTLEEFGKTLSPEIGHAIEQIRYRLYTLEKAVLTTNDCRERLKDKNLYLLVTSDLCKQGLEQVVREAIKAGVDIIQLREKTLPDREIIQLGKRIRELTRDTQTLFIMNDRPDLATLTEADGVHVGQEELSVYETRRIVGPKKLIGLSTHTIEQARKAVLDGADYIGVGPTFPSKTKKFDDFAGLNFIQQVAAEITLPWYAIGGIDTENLEKVIKAGASRVALSSAICSAEDPARAARQFSELLKK